MIEITIKGVKRAPSWEALQKLISTSIETHHIHDEAQTSQMIRIHRVDGGSDYRGLGNYSLSLADQTLVNLMVEP